MIESCPFFDSILIYYHYSKIVQAIWIRQKAWPLGAGLIFPIYLYNDRLVRKHWTDFGITLQECFFCNPLPRLFKAS